MTLAYLTNTESGVVVVVVLVAILALMVFLRLYVSTGQRTKRTEGELRSSERLDAKLSAMTDQEYDQEQAELDRYYRDEILKMQRQRRGKSPFQQVMWKTYGQRSNHRGPRLMYSYFDGKCAGCGERFKRADQILYCPVHRNAYLGSCGREHVQAHRPRR